MTAEVDFPQTHRGYLDKASADARAGTPIDFIASTPGVKRDGLDLRAQGWRLDTFNRNPVFQWVHSRTDPPLGRVEARTEDVLRTAVVFDQEDEFARKIESKYRRGFLNAVSVSWDFVDGTGRALDPRRMSADDISNRAFYDLTELSGVPIPADPDALMQRQRSALGLLGRELVTLFDEQEDPDGEITAEELRAAVIAELNRLGVPIPSLTPAPAASGIEARSARALLAAFNLKESHA